MSHSLVFQGKCLSVAISLAVLAVVPATANASTLFPRSNPSDAASVRQGSDRQLWLMANKNDREVRFDLNRAKNLARQAAEAANGGLRMYRAEASMHGPAQQSPFVDNGDSWTWTFLGGQPGASLTTIETVVTVYKESKQIVVTYNGPVRSVLINLDRAIYIHPSSN